jgi:hypothetical protein
MKKNTLSGHIKKNSRKIVDKGKKSIWKKNKKNIPHSGYIQNIVGKS